MKHIVALIALTFCITLSLLASNNEGNNTEKEFDPTELIMHHIADNHSWHIASWGEGEHQKHIEIPLPIILFNHGKFHFFLFSKFDHNTKIAENKGEYFLYSHGVIFNTDKNGNIIEDENGHISNSKPWDFSLTRNVWSMWLSVALILFIFLGIAKKYKGTPSKPSGIQSLLEPIILFVKDDIIIEQIGKHKGEKFVPYLLTVFFFIWINNLIGLIPFFPGGSNFTGNISVTLVLSVLTLIITNFNGSKSYWKHTLTAPGIPGFVKVLLVPVEIIGIFTKPFALTIRLLANITAGHIIIISIISLIFIMHTVTISPVSIILGIVMFTLELLVAILQAYIFTLLSALFIGIAVHEDDH